MADNARLWQLRRWEVAALRAAVHAAGVITAVRPAWGYSHGCTLVTIVGSGLGASSNSTVALSGVPVSTVVSASDSEVVVRAGPHIGVYGLSVTAPAVLAREYDFHEAAPPVHAPGTSYMRASPGRVSELPSLSTGTLRPHTGPGRC